MARMIPPTIGDDAPPGEHAVFDALKTDPKAADWVVFHSLEIAKHATQVQGEADFVVVAPGHGILIIEVKSHESIEADGEGRWRYGNRDWVTRSPFEQASGAQHSIIEFLTSKGAGPVGYPVFHAAWLTQLSKAKFAQQIGWHDWQLLDAADLQPGNAAAAVIRTLTKASDHLADTISGYRRVGAQPKADVDAQPDAAHTARIVELLTPRFHVELSAKELARRRETEQAKFTTEQFHILDMVAANTRLLVEGPAGTGKTWVAAEAARRAAQKGQRTLVVVFNRLIEARLAELCGEGIEVRRIHSLMAQLVDRHAGKNVARRKLESGRVESNWYDTLLPEQALEAALELGPQFDYLVVDEAQDVSLEQYLDVLDALLVGGLAHAPVFIAADFDHQAIYRRHTVPAGGEAQPGRMQPGEAPADPRETLIRLAPGMMGLQLRANVRTTPEVARFVAELIGEPTLYSEHRRSDDDQVSVERHTFTTMDEQQRLLADAVERILSEPFTVRELVILSPYRADRSAAGQALASQTADARLTSRLGTALSGSAIEDHTRIRWGTIHEFKGLEAPAVILTDVDLSKPYHRDLLYVGASRATDRLVVLEQK